MKAQNPIGISPIILSQVLDEQGVLDPNTGVTNFGITFGQTKVFPAFRHEYAHPYLLDEINIGPIDTNTLWRLENGGLAICGDWLSPFAMCKKLSPWEQGVVAQSTAPLTNPNGEGLLSMLQWKLKHPMLIMPNEQLTVRLTRQGAPGSTADASGPVEWINPVVTLKGRSLASDFVEPAEKIVPCVIGFTERLVPILPDITPQVNEFTTDDGQINNSNDEDLSLDRFGIFTSLDYTTAQANFPTRGGIPFEIPTEIQISDSEGGFILKDLTDIHLLGNSLSRIWDVKGALRAHSFWTVYGEVNLSPFATQFYQPPEGGAQYPYIGAQFSVHGALVGYRKVKQLAPMQISHEEFRKNKSRGNP